MRIYPPISVAIATVFAPLAAQAATVTIDVRDAAGKPMVDSVVMLDSPKKPGGPISFPWPLVMSQKNIMFMPHVLVVPLGASVSFPNLDRVRHHVYSFSGAKKFDLKLYGQDQTRSVLFDKTGLVSVGCNIHDAMQAFIYVVDTPYAAVTNAAGRVIIPNVPAGGMTVKIWNPAIRAAGNLLSQTATVPASGWTTTYTIRGK